MTRPSYREIHPRIAAAICLAVCLPGASAFATILVSTTGNDLDDGLTWATAKRTIQAGIDAALPGEQVWVAAGTYEDYVSVLRGEVFGGFAGDEDPGAFDINQRDLHANRTDFGGGGVYSGTTPTRLDGFYIRSGGLTLESGDITIANSTIQHCDIALIFLFDAPRIINCNLCSNGTVFLCLKTSPHVINCTMAANSVVVDTSYGYSPSFENSIIAQNGLFTNESGSQPVIAGCCIYGNLRFARFGSSVVDPSGSNGNFAADPRLANTAYGDFHLQPDSPCIDAAGPPTISLPLSDADGQSRIQGLGLDVGADEADGVVRPAGPSRIVRVATTGDDANDGQTWVTAMRTIPAAITTLGPQGGDVWVAEGLYDRVDIPSYVHLYGGFFGSEDHSGERDWTLHETILDGLNLRTVVRIAHGHRTSRLDGFTVRNGRSDGSIYGSAVDCYGSGPVISNNRVLDSRSYAFSEQPGGAISCSGSSPLITNNVISGNWVQGNGAGIHVSHGSPVVLGNRFEANSAQGDGGGIFVRYGSPWIIHNQFMGNQARSGSAIYGYSFFEPSAGELQIVGNTFVGHLNTAVVINSGYTALVSGNTFCSNTRGLGAGSMSNSVIVNNVFAFHAQYGMNLNSALILRSNCVFPDVFGGGLPSPTGMSGNISADPRFARNPSDSGDGWGDDPTTPGIDEGANDDFGELRLTAGSPCIDAGGNSDVPADKFDLDGDGDTAEPMPYDLRGRIRQVDDVTTPDTGAGVAPLVDIGAYEYGRGVPAAASASARPASAP